MRGLFFTFEGIEGCGKTTQITLLAELLRDRGRSVMTLREPGGTPLGNVIRQLLLGQHSPTFGDLTEAYLFATSRAELTQQVIRPALEDGALVLCDRYVDSSAIYQGVGRELGVDRVLRINAEAVGDCDPDLTFLFDLEPEIGLGRARSRALFDRIEQEELGFHQRVRRGFLDRAGALPDRFAVVDAAPSPTNVHQRVVEVLGERFPEALG